MNEKIEIKLLDETIGFIDSLSITKKVFEPYTWDNGGVGFCPSTEITLSSPCLTFVRDRVDVSGLTNPLVSFDISIGSKDRKTIIGGVQIGAFDRVHHWSEYIDGVPTEVVRMTDVKMRAQHIVCDYGKNNFLTEEEKCPQCGRIDCGKQ